MKKLFFNHVPDIGGLFLEKVLFSFENNPIVFTCEDDSNEKYLCLCNDMIEEESWMITKISISKLLDVLYDKITVFNAFKTSDQDIMIAVKDHDHFIYQIKTFKEIDELDLPDENEFLEMQQYLKDYIDELNKQALNQFITNIFNETYQKFYSELFTWETDTIIIKKTNANRLDYLKNTSELENLNHEGVLYKSSLDCQSNDSTVSISDSFYNAA